MEIHIEIKSEGAELPSMDETELRYSLEDAIEDKKLGTVVDSGGGMGIMDIFVDVPDEDVEKNKAALEALIKEMGIRGATVTTVSSTEA